MKSRSWFGGFAAVCAVSAALAQAPAAKAPVIAVLDAAEVEQWRAWTAPLGWKVVAPASTGQGALDARILDLQAAVAKVVADPGVDSSRVYLVGRGDAAAFVFYVAARTPDLWAAAVAVGGSPKPAIDSGRFYAGNFAHLPVLWLNAGAADADLAKKLKDAGVPLEVRPAANASPAAVFEWLAAKRREAFPAEADCETSSPQFASCFWMKMTKFDPGARNDVLPSTRMQPGSGATLDLGGFGYSREDAGPGVVVNWLPEKYAGQLKLNDRIVTIGGKPLGNAAELAQMLDTSTEEKPVVLGVQRGKERVRIETKIVLPKRDEVVTARVQGRYAAEEKEIQIISRTAVEIRVTVPEMWVGAMLNWNGTPLVKAEAARCYLLVQEKQLQSAKVCP